MQASDTIKLAIRLRFVTRVFSLALVLGLAPHASSAAESPSAMAPADEISSTNVVTCGSLTVHRLSAGTLNANCYLVCDADRRAIMIDPGACPASLAQYMADQRIRLLAYIMTHSHLDHISALDELVAATPADVAMHPEENDWAFCEKNAWLPAYPRTRAVTVTRPLRHQQTLRDGGLEYTVIHTPGHSPGSVCLWFPRERIVFTGDTLFAGTVGRTDLHRSSQTSLLRSLGVFLLMPAETTVFAGHGPSTTVAKELAGNPFMQDRPASPTSTDAARTDARQQ